MPPLFLQVADQAEIVHSHRQEFVKNVVDALPLSEQAIRFCNIYFKHGCVEFTAIPEDVFYTEIFSIIYGQSSLVCSKLQWAILFLILALGNHFDPSAPWDDPAPHRFFNIASSLIDPLDFEDEHTSSSIKALLLLGMFSTNARAKGSQRNWPWLGMKMRIAQSLTVALLHTQLDGPASRRLQLWSQRCGDRKAQKAVLGMSDVRSDTLAQSGTPLRYSRCTCRHPVPDFVR
ncbi:hypothetical protein CBS101457_004890 [Exobasidium rhododendri]|nr:hypothetical protein CBS101457_004890 [Exobasidium rhododendri]